MNKKISRNDPCPCGSGKKYKKCCGKSDAVSITDLLEKDIIALQREIIEYGQNHFYEEISDTFNDIMEMLNVEDEEEKEFYEFVHNFWFSVFELTENDHTIMECFLSEKLDRLHRPRLKEIISTWTDATAVAGTIIELDQKVIVIRDTLRQESYRTRILDDSFEYKVGSFGFAILLPFDQEYILFPAFFDLPVEHTSTYEDYIQRDFEFSYENDPEEFLIESFIELMYEVPGASERLRTEELSWPSPISKKVADLFREELEKIGESTVHINYGVIIWNKFILARNKRIQNALIYVASLRYLLSMMVPLQQSLSQKELAEVYGVSVSSISSKYNEILYALEEDMNSALERNDVDKEPTIGPSPILGERALHDLFGEINDKQFDKIEDVNSFLKTKMEEPIVKKSAKKLSNKEKAQQLIYDAYEETGEKRYQLARQALMLNQFHPDGYNLLAEETDSIVEAEILYHKGMVLGKQELGEEFFKENVGHFWGLIETRPFMRAKFHYAQTKHEQGEIKEAIVHYEELLTLNPHDNQGVRDSLFSAYCEIKLLGKAEELLEDYDDGTAAGYFNRVLVELLLNGFTEKAKKYFLKGREQNPYIVPYLNGKKRKPAQIPDYFGFGDENEARTYAFNYIHLWKNIHGLKEGLLKW
ncbi:SEC-C metal-binding domain-containing protein [Bacillus sp. 03113]|uniref:SEC-C metal-binding domain-containing protein n=1 Tax=Bacillus sp. 03113 TaxID=2578211 RepID=UPI0011442647|nr:SEC-C metal-binding domain-containing protein [Bacillus sp. 03113]